MRKKLGRNDPCWCGSGLKYKRCHMDREKQEPVSVWQVAKEHRKAFSTKDCLAPAPMKSNCSGTVVKAHTVPKSGSLQQIARNDHLYSFIPSLENMIKYNGRLQPELIGINRASTFTGFCSIHDSKIFSKIESQPFEGSQEQCFLLAYRALAREIYTKKALASSLNIRRQADRGKTLEQQLAIQHMNSLINIGAFAGLSDSEHHKEMYDKVLLSGDFSNVHAYIIGLDSPPPIMCSAGLFPEQDFRGSQLQNIGDLEITPHLIAFTSFYSGDHGLIVFTWLLGSGPACRPFIDSLKATPPNRMTDALIRFFFEFSENLHIKPDWWENLADDKKDTLIDRLAASANPVLPRNSGCIAEDGIKFDNWPISYTKAIGY